MLISLWDQKVKGQSHSRKWPGKLDEYNIFITIGGNFTAYMYLSLRHTDYRKFIRTIDQNPQRLLETGLLRKNLCSCLLVTETNWFLPERDCVTFRSLLSQFRLSSVVYNVGALHPTLYIPSYPLVTRRLIETQHLFETWRLIETRRLFGDLR